ncbi:unnamed protein product, partial [Mesorhabditis spiculigera]
MIFLSVSTSDSNLIRNILRTQKPSSAYPDDPNIVAVAGFEKFYQKLTLGMLINLCLPIFPGYCSAIYCRNRILKKLNDNTRMSSSTIRVQRNLIKALTIQAILPILHMSQCSVYVWKQLELPFSDRMPYFEEMFVLQSALSAITPCITMYYVRPYRRKIKEFLGLRKPKRSMNIHMDTSNIDKISTKNTDEIV